MLKIIKSPYMRLAMNALYALGNSVLGLYVHSWWFITMGAYYAVLAVTRFCVLQVKRKAGGDYEMELFAKKIAGALLIILSVCITGVNVLSIINEVGTDFHEIIMITIATYTFAKITFAIIGLVKVKHSLSSVTITLRNIALAEACVSIYSMQRSMLVSFDGMTSSEIQLMNFLTGTAVFIAVLLLGINLIGGRRIEMAKSKIANTVTEGYKKIENGVVEGYKKIENGVVEGYKKIEKGVTDGYTKIEDKFVSAYLTREGETVEQAKERLKNKDKKDDE